MPGSPSFRDPRPLQRGAEAIVLLFVFSLIALYSARLIWDIDVFWSIVAGRVFVEERRIVTRDMFSAIDPNAFWAPIQWGYEILVYFLDRFGGLRLVWCVHAIVHFASFFVFWWGCRHRLRLGALPSLVLLSLLIVLYADRFRTRALAFNFLFECLLFPYWIRGPRSFSRGTYVLTFAVMLAWGAIHGGGAFIFLLVSLAVPAGAFVERLLDRSRGGAETASQKGPSDGLESDSRSVLRRALIWYCAAAVPVLISPKLVEGIIHTFGMVDATEEYTLEWHPAWRYLLVGSIPAHFVCGLFPTLVVLLWTLPVARVLRRTLERLREIGSGGGTVRRLRDAFGSATQDYPLGVLGVTLALCVLAHRSLRFVYLSIFGFIALWPLLFHRPSSSRNRDHHRNLILSLVLVLAIATGYQSRVWYVYGSLERALHIVLGPSPLQANTFPVAQADYLERSQFEGNVFVQAKWGGYLLYRLWPRVHVLADGRGNYSSDVVADLRRIGNPRNFVDADLGPEIQAIYERYPVDALVLAHPIWPRGFVPDPARWVFVFGDPLGGIWIRCTERGRAQLDRLAALALAVNTCP